MNIELDTEVTKAAEGLVESDFKVEITDEQTWWIINNAKLHEELLLKRKSPFAPVMRDLHKKIEAKNYSLTGPENEMLVQMTNGGIRKLKSVIRQYLLEGDNRKEYRERAEKTLISLIDLRNKVE